MPELERKSFTIDVKQFDGEGTGVARIATLNVIDDDDDLTLPGAFTWEDQWAKVQPAHDSRHFMLGKAHLVERDNEAHGEFKLNLETQAGKDWYSTLKFDMENGKPLQEWSYGYYPVEFAFEERDGRRVRILKKLKVHEISPVMLGAGENTGTVDVKENKRATPVHKTATDDSPWSAAENRKLVKKDEDAGYYNQIYAWRDPDGEVGNKGSWRFIHHFMEQSGSPSKASTRACINAIAVLNGARGGTTIPEADRTGVYNHVAKHLKDAGMSPAELRESFSGLPMKDEVTHTLQAAYDFHDRMDVLAGRIEALKELRAKEGRGISDQLESALKSAKTLPQLEELLRVPAEGSEALASIMAQQVFQKHLRAD
jgi:hypothetical protein